MSALKDSGSTRAWRRTVAYVKARDRRPDGSLVCAWCGVTCTEHDRTLATHAQVDHLDERAEHGTDQLDRLVIACLGCNAGRGARFGNRRRRAATLNASRSW